MWLDPYIHVGPASLAAFLASVWYLAKKVFGTSSDKPIGGAIAYCLPVFFIGIGAIYLISIGHSDLYKVDGNDYNLLVAFTVLTSLPIFFLCVQKGWITPVVPKQDSKTLIILLGLGPAFILGCHLTGIWIYPYPPDKGEPHFYIGRAGGFLLGGLHGIGMFIVGGCSSHFLYWA